MRLQFADINARATNALGGVAKHLVSITPKLRALVELRVSQINGCAFCLDMHSTEAREAGECQQRLDCLAAWEEAELYSPAERAALAWAESLTRISETHAPDELFKALRQHFSEEQIVDLTFIVAVMNSWNRIAIGLRSQPKKRD
jgi:AhpD family alkylhydroperoxidase